MTETERIINFCVQYFNKHDLDTDDEPITSDDIYIVSYTNIGMSWDAFVSMPYGYIYELNTIGACDTVVFNKYRKCGNSLYKWED